MRSDTTQLTFQANSAEDMQAEMLSFIEHRIAQHKRVLSVLQSKDLRVCGQAKIQLLQEMLLDVSNAKIERW
jgi:hypothetical protein